MFGFEVGRGGRSWVEGSDKVPGPLDGTAEHHAEDHPKDLKVGKRKSTSCDHAADEFHSNYTLLKKKKEKFQTLDLSALELKHFHLRLSRTLEKFQSRVHSP